MSDDLMMLDLRAPDCEEQLDSRKRKWCMLYPSDLFTVTWEITGSVILLGTCILTPFTLAFNEELDQIPWYTNLNYAIDIFFFFDIIVNFNMAVMNDQYVILSNRKEITCMYL